VVQPRGVVFDLGGVVMGSPLHAITDYARERGITAGFVNRLVAESGPRGAWSRLERGALAMDAFFEAFDAEYRAAGQPLSAREMMARIGAEGFRSPLRSCSVVGSDRASRPACRASTSGSTWASC
jgi:hypothetical protein